MPRLMEVADLCSRTLSDPANRLRKTRKKKSSVVPPVSQRSHIGNLRQIRKQGKCRSSKRKENRRLSFLFAPPRDAARSRRPQTANPPLRFSEKLPRPLVANPLTQFVCPGQPVQRKEPPVRANTLTQFEHPAQPVLKKLPPGQGEPPARFRCPNRHGAAKKSAAHGHLSTRENQIFLRFTL